MRYPGTTLVLALGMMPAFFQVTLSPLFVDLRQWLAELWMSRWPLAESQLPWIDAIALSAWLAGMAWLFGGGAFLAVHGSSRLARIDRRRLIRDFAPAGVALLLFPTKNTALYLRGEGVGLDGLPALRATSLALTAMWAAGRGWRSILHLSPATTSRKALACCFGCCPSAKAG